MFGRVVWGYCRLKYGLHCVFWGVEKPRKKNREKQRSRETEKRTSREAKKHRKVEK